MKIKCKICGREYEVDRSFIGQKVQCECGYDWVVASPSSGSSATSEKTKRCPFCGEKILFIANKCRFCGEYLTEKNKKQDKNRTLYVVLGLLFGNFGIHNFYAGQYAAAIVKIFINILAMFFLAVGVREAWFIWSGVNTYFVIWDLLYDPNIPTKEREKICNIRPWLFSIIVLLFVWVLILFCIFLLNY